jgi:predicted transcriptional regulator
MGTITISLSDDVEKKLRTIAKHLYGSSKGSLSKVVEDALENYFLTLNKPANSDKKIFKAIKEERVVAEASTLEELASILKKKGIEPRGLRIVSTKLIRPVVHGGYRIKPTL